MCGRFTLTTPAETIGTLFPGLALPVVKPRYNIAPTQSVACVRHDKFGNHELAMLRWGLVPSWAKDLKIGARMINARCETVASKPAYRAAFKKRRCLVLADGYIEWKKMEDGKQPFHITISGEKPAFAMAGLWESWTDKESDCTVESCTVITTDATPSLNEIHDRMPVILKESDYGFWLDQGFAGTSKLESMLQPVADGVLNARPVSRNVNNVRNDEPSCLKSV